MRVHGTHLVYKVKCPCRGLHTLGMSLSEFECNGTIALHWCMKNHRITWVCVHGTNLVLRLVLNVWAQEWDEVQLSNIMLNENGKRIVSGVASRG